MFLAALQLTNSGNVTIETKGELDTADGLSFNLRLLSLDTSYILK